MRSCRHAELGVGITAYGVLSRGLLSGHRSAQRTATAGAFRQTAPRFTSENLEQNLALVETLRRVADAKDVAVDHLAIAWVLSRGEASCRWSGRAGGISWPRPSGRWKSTSPFRTHITRTYEDPKALRSWSVHVVRLTP